jgi:hypothetical protein
MESQSDAALPRIILYLGKILFAAIFIGSTWVAILWRLGPGSIFPLCLLAWRSPLGLFSAPIEQSARLKDYYRAPSGNKMLFIDGTAAFACQLTFFEPLAHWACV